MRRSKINAGISVLPVWLGIMCLLVMAFLPKNTFARQLFAAPPDKSIARFSFTQLTGGVVVVRAGIDGFADSLNFILDTGSGGISLDSSTAAALGISVVPTDRTIRGIAGIRPVSFAFNHTLRLPGLAVDSLDFHINDYQLLSSVYGIRIDGIIGYSFFRRFIVKVDYDQQAISVHNPGAYRYPKRGRLLHPSIVSLPMQYADFTETRAHRGRFYLDTGAGLCLLFSEEYCRDSAIFPADKKMYETMTEGLGGQKTMQLTVVNSFRIGPYTFRKIPTLIFDDEFRVTAYPYLNGLIGNDLLRRFNLIINYAAGEIHLLPNSHFRDNFDYSYTGLSLYLEGNDIVIADVRPGSPGDKAGLQNDDIVVGVANNFSNNLQQYKILLQTTGKKTPLVYKRKGVLEQATISVKNIIK